VRQKLGEPRNGMCGDAREDDVLEPGEGFDSYTLTGGHETAQHCGGLAAFIAAKEYPAISANGQAADRTLGRCCRSPDCPSSQYRVSTVQFFRV